MNIMELSRQIVEVFYRKREKTEDYVVRIEVDPNPLDFDGMDEVLATVVRKDRIRGGTLPLWKAEYAETVVQTSGVCHSVEEALTRLAKAVGVSTGPE